MLTGGRGGVKGMLTLAGDGSGPEFFYMKLLHYNPLSEGSLKAESAKQDFSLMFYCHQPLTTFKGRFVIYVMYLTLEV